MICLGIDTSNYATSLAVYDTETKQIRASVKKLLPVQSGQMGLRQSDAVFAHTKQLPDAMHELAGQVSLRHIDAIGVSACPRDVAGSYMPCFLTGVAAAKTASVTTGAPIYTFSHQAGHVMAAVYGTDFLNLQRLDFFAFHLSGGTTDALFCALDGPALHIAQSATSLDLYAGQVVDRVGGLLHLPFPSGEELSALALQSDTQDGANPVLKGLDCCLSGLENQCQTLLHAGKEPVYVARYCLNSIASVVEAMTKALFARYGADKPVICAGGVLSSMVIRARLRGQFGEQFFFCEPAWLSADNAVGIAILAGRAHAAQ